MDNIPNKHFEGGRMTQTKNVLYIILQRDYGWH